MVYWILLIISLAVLTAIGIYIWVKEKVYYENIEKGDFAALIIIGGIALAGFVTLSIDLPSAIMGGKEIYVDELPTVERWTSNISFIRTDNEELKHLKLGNWEHYEKYGNYCIRYTEPIKFVLEIKPLD